jgi:hypothetical protein
MCQDCQIFAAREVQKADARPGGYIAAGGHSGILGRVGGQFPLKPTRLTFVPARRHTAGSDVNMRRLPASVWGVSRRGPALEPVFVPIKDERGGLILTAIPKVTVVKVAEQFSSDSAVDDDARTRRPKSTSWRASLTISRTLLWPGSWVRGGRRTAP